MVVEDVVDGGGGGVASTSLYLGAVGRVDHQVLPWMLLRAVVVAPGQCPCADGVVVVGVGNDSDARVPTHWDDGDGAVDGIVAAMRQYCRRSVAWGQYTPRSPDQSSTAVAWCIRTCHWWIGLASSFI